MVDDLGLADVAIFIFPFILLTNVASDKLTMLQYRDGTYGWSY